ncbi:MAG: hypothetical protein ABIU29_08155, partial [Chthoniobacterales bacterium]
GAGLRFHQADVGTVEVAVDGDADAELVLSTTCPDLDLVWPISAELTLLSANPKFRRRLGTPEMA